MLSQKFEFQGKPGLTFKVITQFSQDVSMCAVERHDRKMNLGSIFDTSHEQSKILFVQTPALTEIFMKPSFKKKKQKRTICRIQSPTTSPLRSNANFSGCLLLTCSWTVGMIFWDIFFCFLTSCVHYGERRNATNTLEERGPKRLSQGHLRASR